LLANIIPKWLLKCEMGIDQAETPFYTLDFTKPWV